MSVIELFLNNIMKPFVQRSNLTKHGVLALSLLLVLASVAFTPLEPAMVVVLDAGHGGGDPGNLGTGRYKKTEKDITLDVTKKLAAYIEEKMPDVKVVLTRDGDSFPTLSKRVNISNNSNADLFISIHCDAFKTQNAKGCGTYVMGMHKTEESLRVAMQENASIYKEEDYEQTYAGFDPNDPDTYIALALRQNVYLDKSLELGSIIQNQFRDRVGRKDRGVRQAGYYVISFTTMPSVLVELGFLTNPEEEDFLNSENGKTYMASALYRALRDYRQASAPVEETEEVEQEKPAEEPADDPVEIPETQGPKYDYRVQVATTGVKLDKSDSIFQGEQGVEMYISNGQYKYTIGKFTTADSAHVKKRELRAKGFNGAFVAAFRNGERIPMSDVPK